MNPAALTFLNHVPIRRKLTILIMVISSTALLLACAAILLHERHAFRQAMARDLEIIADTFDDNVASGLAFNDPESIEQTLKTLKANPTILAACVYDENKQRVAQYLRADLNGSFLFDEGEPTGQHFRDDRLDTYQDITLDGEVIGSVYIAADLTAITYRLQRSATIIYIVIFGALLLAFFLSTSLQKIISGPITHLAGVASTVATEKDYSVRAVKQSEDELGSLIDAFNEMLSQIQQQDSALQMARDNLETRVQERTRELARSLSLLNATLDSTADGIIAIQFTGEVVCYNRQFADMWEIPKAMLEKPDREELLLYQAEKTVEPAAFIQQVRCLNKENSGDAFDIIRLKSGQTFERYVKPQMVDGQQVGRVVNYRDITIRERSEANLAEANARLQATSRQAGMAEVATSILHNVGNVLNSVSISAEVVSTRVQQFRIGSLRSLGELLRQHEADMPAFLTQDPQGREVPTYLLKLVKHLEEPQQTILSELESLRKNIEHIKEIVSMQQNYARGYGVLESLTMSELIEDAIHINAAGFTRHELSLIRDIQDDRAVLTDRHKVLQILVNLLGNAKYAVSHVPGEKQVIIRVTRDEKDTVHIAVMDNGTGIPPENLTRIFQHGFTTRKDGHGFGLHSGALAARELGGRLTATSPGPGQGATFILELPPSAPDLPLL
jgi:nitrogen fixation/metabolism regulation signal transduction histidine kinase